VVWVATHLPVAASSSLPTPPSSFSTRAAKRSAAGHRPEPGTLGAARRALRGGHGMAG